MIWPSTPRFRIDLMASLVQMHSPIMFASIIARKSRVLLSSNSMQLLDFTQRTLHTDKTNPKIQPKSERENKKTLFAIYSDILLTCIYARIFSALLLFSVLRIIRTPLIWKTDKTSFHVIDFAPLSRFFLCAR